MSPNGRETLMAFARDDDCSTPESEIELSDNCAEAYRPGVFSDPAQSCLKRPYGGDIGWETRDKLKSRASSVGEWKVNMGAQMV